MSTLSLPAELLRDIMSVVSDSSPKCKNASLCSLSLVHSSWRNLAQALLPRQIVLRGPEDHSETLVALVRPSYKHIKTHTLDLRGGLEALLQGPCRERWLRVETLKYAVSGKLIRDPFDLGLMATLKSESLFGL